LATAELLAQKGAQVVIADLGPPPQTVLDKYKNIIFIGANVTSWDQQLQLFRETKAKHGEINIVFANAGITESEMALEDRCDPTTGEPIEPKWSTLDVNLKGLLITIKLALHYMRAQSTGGSIVMTGSRASRWSCLERDD
jgi:NAD(P)-dependent dehydrogenase (short-subunit alcohol dehydrogenase family)